MTLSICARRVALLVAALALSAPARAQTSPGRIVLLNANLIDGLSQEPLKNATVVVHDGKIERVAVGVVDAPAGSTVIDLKGRWLLPGFVDAHAHLRDLKTARAVLTSGTTTVRAMGGDRLTDVGIRELNHAGLVDLPDVVAAGYQVRANMGETFFLDFPELSDLMPGVHGEEAVRRVVRALAGRGVNLIKVMATERTALARTDPLRRIFTDKELAAITDEASRLGLPVAAHAYGPDGTDAAVRAGVHSIEHGLDLTDRTLALMKERGTCYVPTMYEHVREAADGGPEGSPFVKTRTGAMVAPLRDTIVRARRAGVVIAAGSDGPGYADDRWMPDEVAELVAIGMTPMEAIRAATSVAANCLMVSARTGAVKAGLEADLIVVNGNPLQDVRALRDLVLIINNGKVVLNRAVF
jgi:imidazolonepropionase-like amidohydrolase